MTATPAKSLRGQGDRGGPASCFAAERRHRGSGQASSPASPLGPAFPPALSSGGPAADPADPDPSPSPSLLHCSLYKPRPHGCSRRTPAARAPTPPSHLPAHVWPGPHCRTRPAEPPHPGCRPATPLRTLKAERRLRCRPTFPTSGPRRPLSPHRPPCTGRSCAPAQRRDSPCLPATSARPSRAPSRAGHGHRSSARVSQPLRLLPQHGGAGAEPERGPLTGSEPARRRAAQETERGGSRRDPCWPCPGLFTAASAGEQESGEAAAVARASSQLPARSAKAPRQGRGREAS